MLFFSTNYHNHHLPSVGLVTKYNYNIFTTVDIFQLNNDYSCLFMQLSVWCKFIIQNVGLFL